MSRDKYSEEHTIEVVGGTKTLSVSDSLSVTSTVTCGSVVANSISSTTGSTTVAGDLSVTDDLTVTDRLDVGGDTVISGDADVGGNLTFDKITGPRSVEILFPIGVQIFNSTFTGLATPGTTHSINLAPFGFSGSTEWYSFDVKVSNSVGGNRWYSTGYLIAGNDYRFCYHVDNSTNTCELSFIGSDWPSANVNIRVTGFYRE